MRELGRGCGRLGLGPPAGPRMATPTCRAHAVAGAFSAPRVAILGAGLAGLSVAYHLLEAGPAVVDIYDAGGIGAGASGAAAGLLHGYTPRGRLLWMGREGVARTHALLAVAEAAAARRGLPLPLAYCTGILRPPASAKQAADFARFVSPEGGRISSSGGVCEPEDGGASLVDRERAVALMPGLGPAAFAHGPCLHLPAGCVIDPQRYLAGLWAATQDLVRGRGETRRVAVGRVHPGGERMPREEKAASREL